MATSPSTSSSKKVAKAAKAGARTTNPGQRTSLAFPAAMAAVCVLGLALVTYGFFAQQDRTEAVPRLGDHWHSAYGIYICDNFVANVSDRHGDQVGVHTHDDGLIHIHPFSSIATGDDAQLEDFFDEVDIDVSNDTLTMPGGDSYTNGDDCNGEPGQVQLAVWAQAGDAEPSEIRTEDIEATRFERNGQAFVLAFAPEGTEIPKPLSLSALGSVDNTIEFEDPNAPAEGTGSGDVIIEDGNELPDPEAGDDTDTDAGDESDTDTDAGDESDTDTDAGDESDTDTGDDNSEDDTE